MDKKLYNDIIKDKDVPIFLEPWWLDLVTNRKWDFVIDKKKDNIRGVLPYYITSKAGLKGIGMPLLTQFMGPLIFYPSKQKYSKKLSYEKDVIQSLYSSIPKVSFIKQNWNIELKNWLPLHWLKYKQTTRYTYVIDNLSNIEDVFNNFETKIRGDIRKAEKSVLIKKDNNSKILYELINKTFERKKIKMPFSKDLLSNLIKLCSEKKNGQLYYAVDKEKKIHAAVFIIWSGNKAYYLLGGGDSKYRNSGATSLLLWNAMKELSGKVDCFDFEGSMLEPIERFVRGFGGQQVTYSSISKNFSKRYFFIEKINEFKNFFK